MYLKIITNISEYQIIFSILMVYIETNFQRTTFIFKEQNSLAQNHLKCCRSDFK